ncbi:polyamine transporter tpo5 [Vermiconidia calcicola]|uniref:Polyamine transporter tpo5 n=1 Tax=Vermiconidia calcicola TaxID=1690605 RepID=A0ACC3MCF0_9PEZI|nr:polyamine transporter tpo5 [Vermiconidia calcicola]
MVLDDGKNSQGLNVDVDKIELTDVTDGAIEQELGTKYDQRDTVRMGKRQELRRNFQFFSIWRYTVILSCTWKWGLASGVISLTNGGTAGVIWMFLTVCFCMSFVMLSMAELTVALVADGFDRTNFRRTIPLGQRVLAHTPPEGILLHNRLVRIARLQTSLFGTAYPAVQQFEAMATLNDSTYVPQGWHGCLFTLGLTIAAIFFNTILFEKLPLLESIVIVFGIFGFSAIVVVLWIMGPRGGPDTVTTFSDNGCSSAGLSCLVGILSSIITLVGADSQCHLSEELYNAAWVLPRAMVATATANYVMGFVMVLIIMFTIGSDVDAVLETPLRVPWGQIVYNATNSYSAAMTFACLVGLLFTCCLINNVTTASRQLWSASPLKHMIVQNRTAYKFLLQVLRGFARDDGVPFCRFFVKVQPGLDVPANAMIFTLGITIVLSLFIIGSPVAFSIPTSLSFTGLISSYLLAVICVFAKRLRGEPYPPGRFNLGKFGYVCNTIAMIFLTIAFVFMFFPTAPHPGPKVGKYRFATLYHLEPFPSNIKTYRVSDSYPEDAVVSAISMPNGQQQSPYIEADVKAGVKHFIPAEFGANKDAAITQGETQTPDNKARGSSMLDFNLQAHEARLLEDGDIQWTDTTLQQVVSQSHEFWGIRSKWLTSSLHMPCVDKAE